jgi:hypothetical protein
VWTHACHAGGRWSYVKAFQNEAIFDPTVFFEQGDQLTPTLHGAAKAVNKDYPRESSVRMPLVLALAFTSSAASADGQTPAPARRATLEVTRVSATPT